MFSHLKLRSTYLRKQCNSAPWSSRNKAADETAYADMCLFYAFMVKIVSRQGYKDVRGLYRKFVAGLASPRH